MSIISGIIAILAVVAWLIKRAIQKHDDPQNQYQQNKNENARIIETGDQDALNRKLDADLDRLPNPRTDRDSR